MNTNKILQNTRSINDPRFLDLDTMDNAKISSLQLANYRTKKYTKNPKYYFPFDHKLYDLQGIEDQKGPGVNPDMDSYLTMGHIVPRPIDRLAEKVKFYRYVDYLPTSIGFKWYKQPYFLVATDVSVNPQKKFNPEFDIYGVNTRHYNRSSDEYYRKMVNKSNKYRLQSK